MATKNDGVGRSRRGLIAGSLAGAGVAAGGMIFGQPAAALAGTTGLVVITPSGDETGATDRAAIQEALQGVGRQALLGTGTFYIDKPIVMYSNQRLFGSGAQATKIVQKGAGHGIMSVSTASVNYVTISGLTLMADQKVAGSSGIYLVPSTTTDVESFTGISNITIEDCVVRDWGDCGVYLSAAIASRITRVQTVKNGGNGFYVTKTRLENKVAAATSLAFEACYALNNAKNGYELDNVSYSTLNACANDGGQRGYALYTCGSVTLTSCAAEVYTVEGFLIGASKSCSLFGAYTFGGSKVGIHITGTTVNQTIGGAVQAQPGAETTNFILAEAGSSVVVWGVTRPGTTGSSTNKFAGKVTNLDGSA
ncbi:right-handed parallel beta-helix repeat-containing protein [Actinoplanes sp. NPDC051346]|uniref:right-handed parallel beta-helix repeat-containing protein n=1 Tax=Actinoplanes sp. NPDC051346 TaxID=3155048 RepID=UPI003414E74D